MTTDDARRLQARLGVRPDGLLGPITYGAFFTRIGRPKPDVALELGSGAAKFLANYDIDTPLRLAHWMSQMGHESGGFFYLRELGGSEYFRRMYDKAGARPWVAKKLGNTEAGDGVRYSGRGIIQLTGRENYRVTGGRIGVDLEAHPEKAADPETAVLIACDYWEQRKINRLADANDLLAVTKAINGGTVGFTDRRRRFDIAWELVR